MKHLEQLAPDMYAMLKRADASHLRIACCRVCEYVVSYNKVTGSDIDEALAVLRSGGNYDQDLIDRLEIVMNHLDDQYFDLKDRADEVDDGLDKIQLTSLYKEYFRKARAVAALNFSANSNSFDAATEVIYEAAASVPDKNLVFDLVLGILRS